MTVLIGTRKGLLFLEGKEIVRHTFDGIPVQCVHVDPLQRIWVGLDHGHWGPKMAVSEDGGKSFRDIDPPTYPSDAIVKEGKPATLQLIWAMASDEKRVFVGTEPGGLFRSDDSGESWQLVEGLWNHPSRPDHWFGGGRDNAAIHSIWLDPERPERYLIAISCAGVFETTDDGKTWTPRNRGLAADFLPSAEVDVGHDPHLLVVHPSNPERMWQQNHCGVFRSDDGGKKWIDVSTDDGTAYFGFAIAVAEDDPDTAWIVPAISDEVRMAVEQTLLVARTTDGGASWTRLTNGLPSSTSFDLVFRHALALKGDHLAFGTTTGNFFYSTDRGDSWETISNYLPPINVVEFAELT
mgnify:CR=1 FL=1